MTDDDGRRPPGGVTEFVPDEDDRQPPGGATEFVPDEDDRQRPGSASVPLARDDDFSPSGRTMTDLLGRWSRRRGFLFAASLALVLAVAVLAVIAFSVSRTSISSDARAIAAEQTDEDRPAARDDLPIEARPRCSYRAERGGDATMAVTCAVSNHGPIWARVRVTAWLYEREGVVRRVGTEEALLAPAERVTLHFDAPAAPAEKGSRCDCRVDALH